MNISMEEKAGILTRALPYIQKYNEKILVVKYGGNAMVSEELKESVMSDIILLSTIGIKVVLVHGGGPEITGMLNKIGKKSEFVNGLRVTDKETADVVQMVLAGKINKSLVNLLCARGGKAIGLSGSDGGMIKAKPKAAELGYVGEITEINVQPILDVIEMGYIPVVSTVGFDDEGNIKSDNEERYTVTSSTPIIRFNTSKDTVSAYVDGTTTKMSIDDLKDAKYSGRDCSKVFIYTIKGQIKFMMIYE